MRLLFSFAGGYGHFEPLIPLAAEGQRRGHDVLFTAKPAMVDIVRRRGFECVSTGDRTGSSMTERLPLQRLDREREERAVAGFAETIARRRFHGVTRVVDEWHPDVVVCDEVDFGGLLAAEAVEVASASVIVIAAGGFLRDDVVGEQLRRVREDLGLPADARQPQVIAPMSPSIRDPAWPLPSSALWIRPAALAPVDDDADVPEGCIWITLGTEFNRESGDLFARAVDGVAALGLPVLVTVGHGVHPAELGPRPSHVRVEEYVPQAAVLPHARLVVSHAGSGSVIGALAHGVPMVVMPMGADQGLNADRLAALGVGRVLDAVDATADEIRDAARDVLDDDSMRRAAARIADESRALPPAAVAVDALEKSTTSGRYDDPSRPGV